MRNTLGTHVFVCVSITGWTFWWIRSLIFGVSSVLSTKRHWLHRRSGGEFIRKCMPYVSFLPLHPRSIFWPPLVGASSDRLSPAYGVSGWKDTSGWKEAPSYPTIHASIHNGYFHLSTPRLNMARSSLLKKGHLPSHPRVGERIVVCAWFVSGAIHQYRYVWPAGAASFAASTAAIVISDKSLLRARVQMNQTFADITADPLRRRPRRCWQGYRRWSPFCSGTRSTRNLGLK